MTMNQKVGAAAIAMKPTAPTANPNTSIHRRLPDRSATLLRIGGNTPVRAVNANDRMPSSV